MENTNIPIEKQDINSQIKTQDINSPIRKQDINFNKNEPKLNYEYLTNPVKDADGRIIEPARYLDAETFEQKVARVWASLSDEQKIQFYQAMEQQSKLNQQPEMSSGIHR